MSRVLLCNPPAPRPTMRDYYCSSTSKAGYAWQPIDLLAQAAHLRDAHTLIWRDFAVSPASPEEALRLIEGDRPDAIVGLVGAAAPDDFGFWRRVHERVDTRLFVSGDLVRFAVDETLAAYDFIDGVLLDFTAPALRDHLAGKKKVAGLALRGKAATETKGDFAYPVPPYELVWNLPYRHPFLPQPFATVMTDHGCVHRCAYCNSGRVTYRRHDTGNLAAELDWLAAHHVRALFIKDMTFNADRERTLSILEMLARTGPWRFACYLRPDRIDDELAEALAQAGCAMAMVGVESGDDDLLAAVRPGATTANTTAGVEALHRAGVPVGGHFLCGLPGETPAQREKTLALALRLPLAYASFNLAAPRLGTPLYNAGDGVADGSSTATRLLDPAQNRTELIAWRNRAVRCFYLRPFYLGRRFGQAVRNGSLWREINHAVALFTQR